MAALHLARRDASRLQPGPRVSRRSRPGGGTSRLHVRELGPPRGQVVVLLHGGLLDGHVFDEVAALLARRWRVLVPDLPGHGQSPPLPRFSLPAVRAAIEDALRARRVARAAVAGYALGGYHALALALARNVAVYRLVLLGAVAGLDAADRARQADLAGEVRAGRDVGRAFAALALPPAWAATHPAAALALARRANETPPETIAAELEALSELPDLRPRLGEIVARTLVRVGELDRYTPPEQARGVAAAIRGARLEVVPGVGHAYHVQEPGGLFASLERFLAADALAC